MANTYDLLAEGTRYWVIDTNATDIDLGLANEGSVGSFTIHLYKNAATGNGVLIKKRLMGAADLSLGFINCDYQEDSTDVAAGTKITAEGIYYVRADHGEQVRLSFEITGGSWGVLVGKGKG